MKAIWVGIEFSMAIGAVDFLMTELYDEFCSWQLEGLFIENLLPFILTEKLWKYTLNEDILWRIIDYFKNRNDFENLEKVILCLNFENE